MRLSEIQWTDLNLVPEERLLDDPPDLLGVVSVGRAFVFDALKWAAAHGLSPDPSTSLLAADNQFYLVRLPVSIRPGERQAVQFFAVDIKLESYDDQALCWSLMPERVEEEMKISTEAGLNAELKLSSGSLGASLGKKTEVVVYQPYITAFGIGETTAAWEFEPTEGRTLRGVQVLHFVVKAPAALPCTGRVEIRSDIIARGLLWNTRAVARDEHREVQAISMGPTD